jgi:hypothetical protein
MPSAIRVGPAPRVKNAGSETLAARCGLGTRKDGQRHRGSDCSDCSDCSVFSYEFLVTPPPITALWISPPKAQG